MSKKYNFNDEILENETEIEENETDETAVSNIVYEVVKGDNIYSIAKKFNIDYKKLYKDNKDVIGNNLNYILVGTMLTIDRS